MLKIYIARHGQNEDNFNKILNGHRDLPLTEVGRRQATELAVGIKKVGLQFKMIYSSPLLRAHETASIVSANLGGPEPLVRSSLIERNFGVMTGRPIDDIEKLCPDIIKTNTVTYFLSAEGSEEFPAVLQRARRELFYYQGRHKDGAILLVTHSDIGKMLYTAYYDLDWRETLKMFHFGNSELIVLSPDSSAEESHVVRIAQYNH